MTPAPAREPPTRTARAWCPIQQGWAMRPRKGTIRVSYVRADIADRDKRKLDILLSAARIVASDMYETDNHEVKMNKVAAENLCAAIAECEESGQ